MSHNFRFLIISLRHDSISIMDEMISSLVGFCTLHLFLVFQLLIPNSQRNKEHKGLLALELLDKNIIF